MATVEVLRGHYTERDDDWARTIVGRLGFGEWQLSHLRRVEDAAHGPRWLELAHGQRYDPVRSLVRKLPPALLDGAVAVTAVSGNSRSIATQDNMALLFGQDSAS